MIVSCWHWMQLRILVSLAAMAWPSVGSADPARGAPMSRGSRVGYGREIGPRCRGPKSPANVELLQVIEGPLGQPGGPSTIFGSANLAPFANWIFSHNPIIMLNATRCAWQRNRPLAITGITMAGWMVRELCRDCARGNEEWLLVSFMEPEERRKSHGGGRHNEKCGRHLVTGTSYQPRRCQRR